MSRSYRKPWYTDGYKGSKRKQFYKRLSNKMIRRTEDIQDGKSFRKILDPWSICDFKWYVDLRDDYYKNEFWKYNRK